MKSDDWKEVKLEDTVNILGDGLHGTPKYDENGEYYFINGNNLDGKININEKTKKVGEGEYLKYKKDLNERTILISINGTLGNVAVYNGEKVVLGKSACYFNVKENYNKEFVKYVMHSKKFKDYLNTHSTGTTIKNMGLKQMREFKFQIPCLAEQNAIANVLSTLDEKIEINNRINGKLEKIAQNIFKHWFIDFEFPNENGEPYKLSGEKFVESELGMIPEGWKVGKLTDIANLIMGQSPKGDTYNFDGNGLGLINGASDFKEGRITPLKYTTDPKKVSQKGDWIFGVRATVGNVTYVDQEYCLGKGVGVARAKSENVREFLYFQLLMGIDYLEKTAMGSVYINLSKADIENITFIIPTIEVLQEFHLIVSPMLNKIRVNYSENESLVSIRDILLPKLMSGEIRISDAEQEVEQCLQKSN